MRGNATRTLSPVAGVVFLLSGACFQLTEQKTWTHDAISDRHKRRLFWSKFSTITPARRSYR